VGRAQARYWSSSPSEQAGSAMPMLRLLAPDCQQNEFSRPDPNIFSISASLGLIQLATLTIGIAMRISSKGRTGWTMLSMSKPAVGPTPIDGIPDAGTDKTACFFAFLLFFAFLGLSH
jgi:hypothetical protein